MKLFQIRSHAANNILYEGRFRTFRHCVEAAITDRVALGQADLRNTNLANAMLDDAVLPGALFNGANLTGANLSEAVLQKADFTGAALYNTCFACSDLKQSNFEQASFGATDITACDISFASFSTLSCFSLDFAQVRRMEGCVFRSPSGQASIFSHPPVVIKGIGRNPVILLDRHIRNGHDVLGYPEFLRILKQKIARTRTLGTACK